MQDPAATAALPPNSEQQLRCPRCESSNTKFCYYNNYNLAQPRHFCKGCRRYWTHGGALRNVPVGGGSRKASKRSADPTTTPSAPNPKRPTVSPNSPLEILNPEPVSAVAPTADHQHPMPMLDISGGFSSVLRPGGQLLDAVKNLATPSPAESFLELHGDGSCWGGGWPYLSIYAPGSNLQ